MTLPAPRATIAAMPIRPARASDLDPLLALWERSVRATHDFLGDADIESLRPHVRDALGSGVLDLWVLANEGDEPLGFLGMAGDSIEALFLAPEHRRAGLGRRLVDHAQSLRGGELTLDVNEQNPGARAFYEALGFEVVGRSPVDGAGRPFPLLHMRRAAPPSGATDAQVARG